MSTIQIAIPITKGRLRHKINWQGGDCHATDKPWFLTDTLNNQP